MTATRTLILLRHGRSEWNELNLFTGWVDVRLNAQGEKEARRGGELLAEGTPEQVARVRASYTGQYLKKHLAQARA